MLVRSAIDDAIPNWVHDWAAEADVDLRAAINRAIIPWLAARWRAAGGPDLCRPDSRRVRWVSCQQNE